ncbi:unnamed protein product [Angiostrongylus costaricensis]|uniref:Secreted protein n=1 Tax=Angiostrongylus costaricensis TaxID=334426 RepID=A0A0R3PA13_ANGCS|nr:unnamed protein product [Angiostrongylus costaricensis]
MIMTSTVLPILCLMDWHSPKCRLNAPPPRFAPNYDVSRARAGELARSRAKFAVQTAHSERHSTYFTDSAFLESTGDQIDGS